MRCSPDLPGTINEGGNFTEVVTISCETTTALNPGDSPAQVTVTVTPAYSGGITSTITHLLGDVDAGNDSSAHELVGA